MDSGTVDKLQFSPQNGTFQPPSPDDHIFQILQSQIFFELPSQIERSPILKSVSSLGKSFQRFALTVAGVAVSASGGNKKDFCGKSFDPPVPSLSAAEHGVCLQMVIEMNGISKFFIRIELFFP